ncbi:HEAT repeat domain-containing protein [bacterium]|nr:HEAT repeat domain-containing protein [bacterium]
MIHNGPKLIAGGEYNQVLELIEDLPRETRGHIQIETLECFANLAGWVSHAYKSCKLRWWRLRKRLINSGANEATLILVSLLKDENPYLRLYAAELLGYIGDERALKALREMGKNDEKSNVKRYAKKAYEQISGEKFLD